MQTIWKDDRWQPCGIQELLTAPNVKKKYRRAIVLVHPDKQKGKDAAQVMLAERVFEKLKVRTLTYCNSPFLASALVSASQLRPLFVALCAALGQGTISADWLTRSGACRRNLQRSRTRWVTQRPPLRRKHQALSTRLGA